MNRLFSYDWLKQFAEFRETPEEFAERVSLSGPGVERILPEAPYLDSVVVGYVESVEAHPNADRLRVASVRIGAKKVVKIVCGGSNLSENQWVAVALPGARVLWHGEGDPVTIKETELRGVKSFGMIVSANEIGLGDAFPHEEREILDLGIAFEAQDLKDGTLIRKLLGMDDVVFYIEVTTNRVDAMGTVGMARETATILKRPFVWKPAKLPRTEDIKARVKVTVHEPDLCPRYMAVRIDDVTVGPSSWWLKRRLMSAGLNSINNVVDITNLLLLQLAQPLHAFDAGKIAGGIQVRSAKNGEMIKALGGEEYTLDETMLVIADDNGAVAIAGIKGGESSGIGPETMSIILESATFDPVSIRRTARQLGLQSDAQHRFEKGLSTEATEPALAQAIKLILAECGGTVASVVTDIRKAPYVAREFHVTHAEVESLMGIEFPKTEMVDILRRLGFGMKGKGDTIIATVPWWRDLDIESGRDLIEEIARVYGYANIPPVVPVGIAPRPMSAELVWEDRIRTTLQGAGLTETYSYSFVSEDLVRRCGFDPSLMLRVQNELSSDMALMRTTLLPSLLVTASENRERAEELRLFEIANVYLPPKGLKKIKNGLLWTELPDEQLELGAVFYGMKNPWRHAKGVVEHVLEEMQIHDVRWERASNEGFWHPGRSVQAFSGKTLLATLGEVHPNIARRFKLDDVACLHMPIEFLLKHVTEAPSFTQISTFPPVLRDLAIMVNRHVEYADIEREIQNSDELLTDVEWFDTYEGKGLPTGMKSVAVHLTFSSAEKTLESDQVDAVMEKITLILKEKFKAEVR
ncbi:MAG: phenylalanine--tRNA ligase subunit beta [bacterium]|nr:phenylalanine--tRNA ligase subunit beta [bacterium]